MLSKVLSCTHSCLLLAPGELPDKAGITGMGNHQRLGRGSPGPTEPHTHFLGSHRQLSTACSYSEGGARDTSPALRLSFSGSEPAVTSPTLSEALQVCTLTGDICTKQGTLLGIQRGQNHHLLTCLEGLTVQGRRVRKCRECALPCPPLSPRCLP